MSVHTVYYFRHFDNIYAILVENLVLNLLMRNFSTWKNPSSINLFLPLLMSPVSARSKPVWCLKSMQVG